MNFVLTIIFVISTVGIYSVNANDPWTHQYVDKFGVYYSTFIAKMLSIPIAAFPQNTSEILAILTNYNGNLRTLKEYPYIPSGHKLFSDFTKPAIESVLNVVLPNSVNGIEILGKIMTLCQNVNGDDTILLADKFDNLPVRDVLLAYFVNYRYGSEHEFNTKYCHNNSESFPNSEQSSGGQMTKWDRINNYFNIFFNEVTSYAMNSPGLHSVTRVSITENQKDYKNEVFAAKTLSNDTYKTDDGCMNCIESKLEFLLNAGFPRGSDITRVFASIKQLCQSINEDNYIDKQYRHTNLPARQVLKDFYLSLGGLEADFDKICRAISLDERYRQSGILRRKHEGESSSGQQQRSRQRR